MKTTDKTFWEDRWKEKNTPWDIGYPSPPITAYIDHLGDASMKILIPGCGNAFEAQYLIQQGFANTYVIDIAPAAIASFLKRFPDFPKEQAITGDFFDHRGEYDLILEQTFFCAIDPSLRSAYAAKVYSLLKPGGRLAGLLFDDPLNTDHPPYGGNKAEYKTYFSELFEIHHMETAHNSIKPRAGRELFIEFRKPS